MSDNKPEPVASIEECDRETCREFLGEYYGTAQEFDDALLMQFAKHRTAAVARREAEIVGILQEELLTYKRIGNPYAAEALASIIKRTQSGGGV